MHLALTDSDDHKHFWYTHTQEFPPIFGPGFTGDAELPETAAKTETKTKEEVKSEKDLSEKQDSDNEDMRELILADDPELWSCISF